MINNDDRGDRTDRVVRRSLPSGCRIVHSLCDKLRRRIHHNGSFRGKWSSDIGHDCRREEVAELESK